MKTFYLLPLAFLLATTACTHETKVVESKYPNGTPKKVCVYKGDDASRELINETTYYPDKKIQMQGEYKDNKRDGRWIYYYPNGNPWSEGSFKKGKSDGKRTTYYENGKINYTGYYKDDVQVGVWSFYDEKGKLIKSVDYSKTR